MANSLTYEKVLELIAETEKSIKKRWEESEKSIRKRWEESDKRFEESRKEFEKRLEKEAEEREKSKKEFDKRMKKLDGKFGNVLGAFASGLVEPKLLELFRDRGILVSEIYHNVQIHSKGFDGAEIDLLLANSNYSVAVEVKTTLTVEDVKEHLLRLDKLQKNPIRIVRNTILLGAVAGMRIAEYADKFAYRRGLFVLRQKGEIVEIANDEKFRPKEWKVV